MLSLAVALVTSTMAVFLTVAIWIQHGYLLGLGLGLSLVLNMLTLSAIGGLLSDQAAKKAYDQSGPKFENGDS